LIEIILIISLLGTILAIATPNLFTPLGVEKVNSLSTDIISLLKDAQTKAISSETFGQGLTEDFGIHFAQNSYTLFKGSVYNPADTNNFSVATPNSLSIVPNLPCPVIPNDCNNIVFSRLTGEVQNFDQAKNSLCISDSISNTIKLETNYLGVVNAQTAGC